MWTIVAGVVVIAGVVVVVAGLLTPVTFGWFAYQPLAKAPSAPAGNGMFVSRVTIIGWALLGIGLVALAFLIGVRIGANRADARDVHDG